MTRNRWWMIGCGLVLALAAGTGRGQQKVEPIPAPRCCGEKQGPCCCEGGDVKVSCPAPKAQVYGLPPLSSSFTSDLDIPIKSSSTKSGTAVCPTGLAEPAAQPKCCPPAARPTASQPEGSRPAHERCYAGGFRTMRGFQLQGVAPDANGCQLDGSLMLLHTLEYQVPVLGNNQLYGVTFVDSGTVDCNPKVQEQRVSAGPGIRIVVPMLGPVPIALDFPIKQPESVPATAAPVPPQCCPPPVPSPADVHSAKTEPAKTCDCCTCCPKCGESKTKQKRAHFRVIPLPPAPVTYGPGLPVMPVMPCPPIAGVNAVPMIAPPMIGPALPLAPAQSAPPMVIYSNPVSGDVIKQCNFTIPVVPPAPQPPAWRMHVAKEGKNVYVEFCSGREARVTCQEMNVKIGSCHQLGVSVMFGLSNSGLPENQLAISGSGLIAAADSITKPDGADRIVLEGHVRLNYHKDGTSAKITAEHVVIDLKDGYLSVKLAAPKGEDPAKAQKEKAFQFWIGMCH